MKRNTFLTLLFSLVPGAGQMFQGYMKRGVSLAVLFLIPILAGAILPGLASLAAIVYMYSFFDSLNLHSQLKDGGRESYAPLADDDYLVHLGKLRNEDFERLVSGQHHLLGWGIVLVGCVLLYHSCIRPILNSLIWLIEADEIRNVLFQMIRGVPQLAFAVVLVLVGLWLIHGPKKQKDEFEAYQGENNG